MFWGKKYNKKKIKIKHNKEKKGKKRRSKKQGKKHCSGKSIVAINNAMCEELHYCLHNVCMYNEKKKMKK